MPPRASKKQTEIVPENKTEPPPPKPEPKKKDSKTKESKTKEMETDPKLLHKHIKEKDKELHKIRMLVEKMVKVME